MTIKNENCYEDINLEKLNLERYTSSPLKYKTLDGSNFGMKEIIIVEDGYDYKFVYDDGVYFLARYNPESNFYRAILSEDYEYLDEKELNKEFRSWPKSHLINHEATGNEKPVIYAIDILLLRNGISLSIIKHSSALSKTTYTRIKKAINYGLIDEYGIILKPNGVSQTLNRLPFYNLERIISILKSDETDYFKYILLRNAKKIYEQLYNWVGGRTARKKLKDITKDTIHERKSVAMERYYKTHNKENINDSNKF